jgi:hypothetical protein
MKKRMLSEGDGEGGGVGGGTGRGLLYTSIQ